MASRERLHRLVEELPEAELPAAERFLEFLRQQSPETQAPSPLASLSPEERRARVYALAGKYASAHRSVDDFLREKHEEVEREEAEWDRRHGVVSR